MRPLLIALCFAPVAGCIVVDNRPGRSCTPPLELQPNFNVGAVHIAGGYSATLPGGGIGYIVTSNGQYGWSVAWYDTANSSACFSGVIAVEGHLDQTQVKGLTGTESLVVSDNVLAFSSVAG